jgi:hypothetical protein
MFYVIAPTGADIMHFGKGHDDNPPGRGSGRYPWGSGKEAKEKLKQYKSSYSTMRKNYKAQQPFNLPEYKEYYKSIGNKNLDDFIKHEVSTVGNKLIDAYQYKTISSLVTKGLIAGTVYYYYRKDNKLSAKYMANAGNILIKGFNTNSKWMIKMAIGSAVIDAAVYGVNKVKNNRKEKENGNNYRISTS